MFNEDQYTYIGSEGKVPEEAFEVDNFRTLEYDECDGVWVEVYWDNGFVEEILTINDETDMYLKLKYL